MNYLVNNKIEILKNLVNKINYCSRDILSNQMSQKRIQGCCNIKDGALCDNS